MALELPKTLGHLVHAYVTFVSRSIPFVSRTCIAVSSIFMLNSSEFMSIYQIQYFFGSSLQLQCRDDVNKCLIKASSGGKFEWPTSSGEAFMATGEWVDSFNLRLDCVNDCLG